MELHWGKHHRAYVTNLNGQIKGTDLENKPLEEIVKATWAGGKPAPAFNNAAQVWNHTFYWESMSPKKTSPGAALAAALARDFGSMDNFVKEFSAAGATQFGSGWAWLVVERGSGKLAIRKTANAETPLTDDSVTAILTMDGAEVFSFSIFFFIFIFFDKTLSHLVLSSIFFSSLFPFSLSSKHTHAHTQQSGSTPTTRSTRTGGPSTSACSSATSSTGTRSARGSPPRAASREKGKKRCGDGESMREIGILLGFLSKPLLFPLSPFFSLSLSLFPQVVN